MIRILAVVVAAVSILSACSDAGESAPQVVQESENEAAPPEEQSRNETEPISIDSLRVLTEAALVHKAEICSISETKESDERGYGYSNRIAAWHPPVGADEYSSEEDLDSIFIEHMSEFWADHLPLTIVYNDTFVRAEDPEHRSVPPWSTYKWNQEQEFLTYKARGIPLPEYFPFPGTEPQVAVEPFHGGPRNLGLVRDPATGEITDKRLVVLSTNGFPHVGSAEARTAELLDPESVLRVRLILKAEYPAPSNHAGDRGCALPVLELAHYRQQLFAGDDLISECLYRRADGARRPQHKDVPSCRVGGSP